MRKGIIWATWSPAARLDLARLKAQLFTWRGAVQFGAATATVTGDLRRDSRGWLLEASGTRQRFRLAPAPRADPPGAQPWETLTALAADPGARLRVTGELRAADEHELGLTVARVEPVPPPTAP